MLVKANVAYQNDGLFLDVKVKCDLPISELCWWFFTSIIYDYDLIKTLRRNERCW